MPTDTHPNIVQLSPESEQRRLVATSLDRPLEQRVEALEDIIESELGDTALVRAESLDAVADLGQVYLKLEIRNPTGSHLVRVACAHALDALRRGCDGISVGGRHIQGEAFAFAAWLCGLRCAVYVPGGAEDRANDAITGLGAVVVRVAGNIDAAVIQSRQQARQEGLYDANPTPPNATLERRVYGQIANEVFEQFGDAPAAIALPGATDTLAAGIHRGFVRLKRRGKSSRVPRIVIGLLEPDDGSRDAMASVREAVDGSSGWVVPTTDASMTAWSRRLRECENIGVSPAATAGLVALLEHPEQVLLQPDRYVVILTALTQAGESLIV